MAGWRTTPDVVSVGGIRKTSDGQYGGGAEPWPHRRRTLLSLSQNRGTEVPFPESTIEPSSVSCATKLPSLSLIDGLLTCGSHDHRLRNQSVGSTSIVASAGPALRTVTRRQTSSGAALA
jgi:hypothetical protein